MKTELGPIVLFPPSPKLLRLNGIAVIPEGLSTTRVVAIATLVSPFLETWGLSIKQEVEAK